MVPDVKIVSLSIDNLWQVYNTWPPEDKNVTFWDNATTRLK